VRVLHVSDAYHPAYAWGGPVYSLHALCKALARIPGVDLQVITTDTAGPHTRDNLRLLENPVQFAEGFQAFYCRRIAGRSISPQLIAAVRRASLDADVIHLTGAYSFPTIPTIFLSTLYGKPLVWSPRGALQRWRGSTRRLEKWGWERICDAMLTSSRCVLHVTSLNELKEASTRIRRARGVVIPNGVDIPRPPARKSWKPDGLFRLLYLGRLDPKKGIENMLRAVSQLSDLAVRVAVYGGGDSHYAESLHALVGSLGLSTRVQFHGHVEGAQKEQAFLHADACIVPSFTENFGMAVAEALAHGLPVIASRGTPWSRIEEKKCGLWVENDSSSLADAIRKLACMRLEEMGQRGRLWMAKEYGWDGIASAMHDVYTELDSRKRTAPSI
jgi:glycosyltransferase involved in cell wall biosynthesis